MAELYEPTIAFNLWVLRDGEEKVTLKYIADHLLLPKSKKRYKLTLKNLKVFIDELMDLDKSIKQIQIDRITSVGTIKR